MKTLTIVFVTFNCSDFLYNSLNSLEIRKHFPDKWKIIIVDNNSNKDEKEKLIKITQRLKEHITVIELRKNLGWAKANNIALKKIRSAYVLLLNPDTLPTQYTIKRVLAQMQNDEQSAVATAKLLLEDGTLDDACHRGFPTPWNAFCHFTGLSRLFSGSMLFNGYHLGYRNMRKTHEIMACAGAFMMVRAKVGKRLGWIDEDYFWYGDDLDFCYRAHKAGFSILFVADAVVQHLKGVTSGIKKHSRAYSTASPETQKLAQKARFEAMRLFYKKHYEKIYPRIMTDAVSMGISLLERLHRIR